MRANPLESVADAITAAIDEGLTAEGAARRVMQTLDERAQRILAKQHLLDIADVIVRSREHTIRKNVITVREPAPKTKHGTTAKYRAGCRCDQCVKWREVTIELEEEHQRKLAASIYQAVEQYKTALHAEWSAELLASTFGTPNGRVTWAAATVEDHRMHVEMVGAQMVGMMQDSALHLKAIDEIETGRASCLGELLGVAA